MLLVDFCKKHGCKLKPHDKQGCYTVLPCLLQDFPSNNINVHRELKSMVIDVDEYNYKNYFIEDMDYYCKYFEEAKILVELEQL